MKIDLTGKTALVGGSSRGIGRAIATQLAASGASVTLMARTQSLLEEVVAALDTSQGQQHHFLVVDFNDFDQFKAIVAPHIEKHPIDILVNNTQGPPAAEVLDLNIDDYQKAFNLLFKCVVWTTHQVLEGMQQQQWGRVINVSSVSVKEPLAFLALSNSIRASVVTWAKTLASGVAPNGITVNSILTGYFDTERLADINAQKAKTLNIPPEKVREHMNQQVPVKRIGDPAEYGCLVAFLASPQAGYINGTNIPIDGGLSRSL